MYIRNMQKLLSYDENGLKEDGLNIINSALIAADPYNATKNKVKLIDNNLMIDSLNIDITKKKRIFVLGGGKAAYLVAKALEEILKERITKGLIILKDGYEGILEKINIITASHPIPNESGFKGAQKIMKLAKDANKEDLVFWINTGGISALAPYPIDDINLEEKKFVNELLLSSGANIKEINTVRSHLSKIKGGKLAMEIFPAEIINLIISDNPGDPINVGPTGLDDTTFSEAISILKYYNLWQHIPNGAKKYLLESNSELETPKDFGKFQSKIHSFMLVNNRMACLGAIEEAKKRGYNTIFLSSCIEGESKDVAKVHIAIGKEIISSGNPIKKPACIISGGETVVTINGNGKGGRNLEFALSSAIEINDLQNIVVISLGTDGTDGPTDAAGAIVENRTLEKASKRGLIAMNFLKNNDSYNFFRANNELIFTGHTGTNVMDIRTILIK